MRLRRHAPADVPPSIDRDVDLEIREHLHRRTRALVAAGATEAEAGRRALAEFGDVSAAREEIGAIDARVDARRRGGWLAQFGRDLRQASRLFRRMPGLAAVVAISLGVGIGVNTIVFSWIESLVLKPLPGVSDAARLKLIEPRAETGSFPGVSWLELKDLQAELTTFESVLAARMVPLKIGEAGRSERKFGQFVSGNFFTALGVRPALGRLIVESDAAEAGGAPVAVLSYEFWQAHFEGSPAVVGQPLRVNDRPLTVIGVTPEGFIGTMSGVSFDVWVPGTLAPVLQPGSMELASRGIRGYSAMGRLKRGVSMADAQADVDALSRRLAAAYPSTNRTVVAEVREFWRTPRGPRQFLVSALLTLQAAMLILMLAICGNTATLLLARATSRTREMAVRLALGAGRARIVSLLLAESTLLALAGAAIGIVLTIFGTEMLRNDLGSLPRAFPLKFDTNLSGLGVMVAAALAFAGAALFGIAPAFQLARIAPTASLRISGTAVARNRLRDTIMAAEVALALMVLVVAGLFFRSYRQTIDTDPGFDRAGVALSAYELRGPAAQPGATRTFIADLLDRLRALPGVESAAVAVSVPLDIHGMPIRRFTLEGHTRPDGEDEEALTNTVTPGYFETMRMPIVSGSTFADMRDASAPPQAVVNEEFVRRFADGRQILGRRIENGARTFTIAGVVRNSLYESFGEPPTPMLYFSYRDRPTPTGEIHVRTRAGQETRLLPDIQRLVRGIDADLPVFNPRSLSGHVDSNLFYRRIPARMFIVLGPLLLALTAIGIYAVVSYAAARRTTEVGVRLALGATPRRVVTELLGETMRVVALGAVVGWIAAWWFTGRVDAAVYATVPIALLLVAALACWVPARRATRIDPLTALRQD